MSKLKTFTGFRGVVAFGEISGVQFALVVTTPNALKNIWEHLLPDSPFIVADIQKAVLVHASVLNDPKPAKPAPENPSPTSTAIDV